jgi:hypothetical protein
MSDPVTDPWQVAYVLWTMANLFGQCRLVSVAQPPPPKLATVLTLFDEVAA